MPRTRSQFLEFPGTHRFQVIRRLGAGGMGVVYEVLDRERNERVALKTLRSMTPDGVLQFKREFRSLQDIGHPNLVRIGELIAEENDWFMTMELVDGVDFLEWTRPGAEAEGSVTRIVPARSDLDEPLVSAPTLSVPVSAHTRAATDRAGGETFDEARLRDGLAQLARGLAALHEAGTVHRDVKPSNILVTREGRVVLLDFGLATEKTRAEQLADEDEGTIVGTVEYMSPEQAAARPIGPETDWYSVGVLLYEALTGQVPFVGSAIEILAQKQRNDIDPPGRIVAGLPSDLERLCSDLLRFEPGKRPGGREVLERLGERTPRDVSRSRSSFTVGHSFIGRQRELALLERAYEQTKKGSAVAVVVQGESGLGKSALVRRFASSLARISAEAVVLSGRCYESESVPYKALDGVIDALSRYLVRLPKTEASALLPRHTALLAEVFPVLSRIEAVAECPQPTHRVADPQEQRGRVFSALRELLGRLTDRRPLVILIDDLQWADADSLALLGELLRPPDAPAMLVVATARPLADAPPNRLIRSLPGTVELLDLERLTAEEAFDLALQIERSLASTGALDLPAIIEEAGGHPLFLDELIRYSLTVKREAGRPVHLEEALWARIQELDPATRHLLELLSLAGGPVAQQTAAQASLLGADFAKQVALLRVAHFIRTTGMRGSDRIETYHDRVREAIRSHLPEQVRRAHHQRLAVVYETSQSADPESLMVHWREAGVPGKAAHYAWLGAAKAERALAFDRAARLYQSCLELDGGDAERTRELQVKRGDALANSGRGAESAEAYLSACGDAGAAQALDLRRRAAEQLLRSGRITEGLEVTRTVLGAVGMSLASTPARALASVLFRRAQLRTRGLAFRERDASQIPAHELTRIDVCWSVGIGLGIVDTIRGADFQARNLLLSLKAGEPYRIARALSLEVMYTATAGIHGAARTRKLLEEAQALAQRSRHPQIVGLAKMAAGVAAFLEGRFPEAKEACAEAEGIFRERCSGVAWELAGVQTFMLWSLYFLGELPELARRVPLLIQEAQERGDLYALTMLRTEFVPLCALVSDDPERAAASVVEAMRGWINEGFHLEHVWELHATTQLALYRGEGPAAYQRVTSAWRALERSLLLRTQQLRIEFLYLRGRSALAAAQAQPERRRELIREGRRDAKLLAREKTVWADPLAGALLASAASLDGDLAGAADRWATSAAKFNTANMPLHAAMAQLQGGLRAAGTSGGERVERARQFLAARTVKNPERLVAMLMPPA